MGLHLLSKLWFTKKICLHKSCLVFVRFVHQTLPVWHVMFALLAYLFRKLCFVCCCACHAFFFLLAVFWPCLLKAVILKMPTDTVSNSLLYFKLSASTVIFVEWFH